MSKKNNRIKRIHEPTTHEVFGCLSQATNYCKILSNNSLKKRYLPFLYWLIDKNFYNTDERREKVTIKKIATDFNSDPTKVTKWLREIYEDIFDLNEERPELFHTNGIKITFHISHYDSYCRFSTSLPMVPREFESVQFHFVKAKVGIDSFWVKDVYYEIDEQSQVDISLKGGFVNRYREFILEKALFQNEMSSYELSDMHDFQIDDWLKKLYK